jgi:hypothetical protein
LRGSSQPISLFSDRQPEGQRPLSFIFSILAHGAVIGLVAFGVLFAPRIRERPLGPRMLVREVHLDAPDPQMRRSSGSDAYYPDQSDVRTASSSAPRSELASSRPKLPTRVPAAQTIVQPDISMDKMLSQKIPVPAMLLWSANRPKVKTITPPKPQQLNATSVIPRVERPNKAINLADIAISPTEFTSNRSMRMPSTTTPIVLPGPHPINTMNETSSVLIDPASAGEVASISNLVMRQGVVTLPPVNQVAAGNGGAGTSANGNGSSMHGSEKSGNGGNGTQGNTSGHQGGSTGAGGGKSGGTGSNSGQGSGSSNGNGARQSNGHGFGEDDGQPPLPINRPKDGKFGVVVVGNSALDDYPQSAQYWSGRIVYTVFLHVGLAKNWLLQYSVPRKADAAAGGNSHIMAPWPYYILRPNIDSGEVNADAMIVHGFVNANGRFESLQIVFPDAVGHAQTLLNQMAQWQFRPATDNGQPTKVEILLIIPQGD